MDKIRKIKEKEKMKLLRKRGAKSVGIGYKMVDGKITDEPAIIVNVKKKLPKAQLKSGDMIPSEIEGIKTDVFEIGEVVAQEFDPQKKYRPAPGGVSIGHKDITAGTLGCLVKKDGQIYILSNNHVLANENYGKVGDAILQPGPYDGGTLADKIAVLSHFIPIDFGGEQDPIPPTEPDPPVQPPDEDDDHWCPIVRIFTRVANAVAVRLGSSYTIRAEKFSVPNYVDAALAGPVKLAGDVSNAIAEIGLLKGTMNGMPPLLSVLRKFGRTTRYQESKTFQIHATVNVGYSGGRTALFEDQIIGGVMSQGGDSGSIVVNENNIVVGLLFAGSASSTIINPIQFVIDALKLEGVV